MSEENKALTRRSWEIVATGSLDTLDDALQEVYAEDIVMHEPDEDVRGIEGLTQFVSMIRSALPDLRIQRFAVKLNQSRHGYARLVQEVLSEEKHA